MKLGCKYLSETFYTSSSSDVVSLIASLFFTVKKQLQTNANIS